jgi:predicted AAA+ superfamily ATPase
MIVEYINREGLKMRRDIYHKLLAWKASSRRKPLILRGARQVGKTFILKYFAQAEYKNVIYINFDEEPHFADFFSTDLNPDRILNDLNIYFKKKINAKDTLLIFDEIQECSTALNSLKYFCEKRNDYHIVAAGSLLGVKMTSGFPVGKVNFLDLAPLNFFEFLEAIGDKLLRELLENLTATKPILIPFHENLTRHLKTYFITGGMPEAVKAYIDTANYEEVREVQKEILNTYTLDFAKHAPPEDIMKIMSVWELIPTQLAKENKKFIFTAISKSARAKTYESAIQWLVNAGLIIRSHNINTPKLPLEAAANRNAFKVFLLDVGLLGAMTKLDPKIVLEGDKLFVEFKGALTENYVAQTLYQQHNNALYYWTSAGIAEVDFILSSGQKIFPLEVKAGISKQKKSLLVYGKKYHRQEYCSSILSRGTMRNFTLDDNILNYPLYAISLFPRFSQTE